MIANGTVCYYICTHILHVCFLLQLTLMLKCSTVGTDDTVDSKSSSLSTSVLMAGWKGSGEGGETSMATSSGGWLGLGWLSVGGELKIFLGGGCGGICADLCGATAGGTCVGKEQSHDVWSSMFSSHTDHLLGTLAVRVWCAIALLFFNFDHVLG